LPPIEIKLVKILLPPIFPTILSTYSSLKFLTTISSYSPSGNVELITLLIASLMNSLLLYAVTITLMKGLFVSAQHNSIITKYPILQF